MKSRPAKTFGLQLLVLWSLWASVFVMIGYGISQFRPDEIIDFISKPVVWLGIGMVAPACINFFSRLLRMSRVAWKGRGIVESNQPTIVLLRPFNRDPELQTKAISDHPLPFSNRFQIENMRGTRTYIIYHFDFLVDIVYVIVSMAYGLLGLLDKIFYRLAHYETF